MNKRPKAPEDGFGEDKELAKKWGEEYSKEWQEKLDSNEKLSIIAYNNEAYQRKVDADLKEYQGELGTETDGIRELIDLALSKIKTPKIITTYEYVTEDFFVSPNFPKEYLRNEHEITIENATNKIDELKKHFIDKPVTFKNYTYINSLLSLNGKENVDKYPIILHYKVPEGMHAAYIDGLEEQGEQTRDETALLIERGTSFKCKNFSIINVKGKEYLKINVEFVEQREFGNDVEEAEKWGNESYIEWEKKLEDTERLNIKEYTDQGGSVKINSFLRKNNGSLEENTGEEDLINRIKSINSGLDKTTVTQEMCVYRRINENAFGLEVNSLRDWRGNINHSEFENFKKKFSNSLMAQPAFISTSLVKHIPFLDGDPILMRINIPKGIHGAYIENISETSGEHEFLIKQGYNYYISDISIIKEIKEESKQDVVAITANLIPDLQKEDVIDLHPNPNWQVNTPKNISSISFKNEKTLPFSNEIVSERPPVFKYMIENNGKNLGVLKPSFPENNSLIIIDFLKFNNGKPFTDVDHIKIYAINPVTKIEYLIAEHKPNITIIGAEFGKLRFSIIDSKLYVTGEKIEQTISDNRKIWHIYIDELEVYTFLETDKVENILKEINRLSLVGNSIEITDKPYRTIWILSSSGYYIDGIIAYKINQSANTKYEVFVNGNSIGKSAPSNINPDGSHEILFTEDYFDMDGWGISKNDNNIVVYAIDMDRMVEYEIAHSFSGNLKNQQKIYREFKQSKIIFNFYNSTCNIFYNNNDAE